MTVPRAHHRLAITCVAWLAVAAVAAGQDTLGRARELYVQASYDEALLVLTRLHATAPPGESSEIAGYQVLCLLALGRKDEARRAIAALVTADPLYRPSEATMSPRTRAAFDEVRRGLLPGIAQEMYDKAKAAFDRKEWQAAVTEFDRVLALLDQPELADAPNMTDLRRLAIGFRDLSNAAVPPAPVAAPAKAPDLPATTPPPAPVEPAALEPPTYKPGEAGIVPPVAISRPTPPWQPRSEIDRHREFRGVLLLLVDEKGDVTSAVLLSTVHPSYDAALVTMARTWKFRPGTKAGVPVRCETTIEVRLQARPSSSSMPLVGTAPR
jgi:tetratricopeptide (TPR) repeat protein